MCHPFLQWVHRFFLEPSSQIPLVWFYMFSFITHVSQAHVTADWSHQADTPYCFEFALRNIYLPIFVEV